VFGKKPLDFLSSSIDANDFDVFAHPIRRQVDPAAVSTWFDFLFDHLFPDDSELGLGGLAGIIRLPADFLQTSFPFQNDPIFLRMAEQVNSCQKLQSNYNLATKWLYEVVGFMSREKNIELEVQKPGMQYPTRIHWK